FPLFDDMSGDFAHNPEPLPAHLSALSREVLEKNAQLGVSVDPDVDRLALVCEDGEMFGEEYSLVAIADYILKHNPGNTVSNLSSTRALNDVTERYGAKYAAAAVGEVNVVTKMKETNAVIGGEGNGGIIYPALHYGRDAMVGLALFLSHLAHFGRSVSYLRSLYPNYWMAKNKINLTPDIDIDSLLDGMEEKYKRENINRIDGLKIDFEDSWIHLRKSNTEPIIRIYTEASSQLAADNLAEKVKMDIGEIIRSKH
ncbi:MAG: phosphoglucosamine mutase, partial [Saprospiraceae bacterium]|nr:phosphoglucosamine mutase [Saprospiraceae bacterium]